VLEAVHSEAYVGVEIGCYKHNCKYRQEAPSCYRETANATNARKQNDVGYLYSQANAPYQCNQEIDAEV